MLTCSGVCGLDDAANYWERQPVSVQGCKKYLKFLALC